MDRIRIVGGAALGGKIAIGGAKNAALPIMTAALLTEDCLRLTNLPHLADIATMAQLLSQHGVELNFRADRSAVGGFSGRVLELRADNVNNLTAHYDLVRKMRASILALGPLLARFGKCRVSLPGGCAIGARPVDQHLSALKILGADITLTNGYIDAKIGDGLGGRLRGGRIVFPMVTVGATENALMAATLARGETTIVNAAREPEVVDLTRCLIAMGANIEGVGSNLLRVIGVDTLHGAEYEITSDRIEAGTYAVAAAITRSHLELTGTRFASMGAVIAKLMEMGIEVVETKEGIRVRADDVKACGADVMTEPYPGFPTDMQAQIMALAATATGSSLITESIFENRFMHVSELSRMGARVNVQGRSAIVRGVPVLSGASVMATDLRASVSLILAGLAASGETIINRVYHLDRGYERLEEKLLNCGADIERLRS